MATPRDTTSQSALARRTETDRRQGKGGIHFPERRLGFERRRDPSTGRVRRAYLDWILRISRSPHDAALLMGSIVVLAVADMAFTFAALDRGLEELNPVMAFLLDTGHGFAAFVKVGVTALLAVAGWRFRRYRRVIEAGLLVVVIMSLVVLYHLLGLLVA